MSALRELLVFFGAEVDDKQLDRAGEKMEHLASIAENVGAAIGLAFGLKEIGEFVKGQVEVGAELLHTSEMLGLTVGDLQAFQYAAANAGLGADEATTAMRFLNKNLGEAATKGGDSAAAFEKLGVHIKDANGQVRPTQDILSEVADGFVKLPGPAEKTAKAMEIFGRAGSKLIPLLNKGSKGIDEFYTEFEKLGGGIDEEFVQAAEEGEHQMNKLNLVWKSSKATIANALLPAFTWLVSSMTEAVSWLRQLSTHSNFLQVALWSLAAVTGALALIWAVLNIEIIAVVVVFALIVLAIDDIYTAFTGGKSVIGDFIDSIFGVGATQAVVGALKGGFDEVITALGGAWDAAKALVGAFGSVDDQSTKTEGGLSTIVRVISAISGSTTVAIHLLTEFIKLLTSAATKYEELKKNNPTFAAVVDKLSNPVGTVVDSAKGVGNGVLGLLGYGDATHAAPAGAVAGAASGPADVTNHTTIQVDVKTTGSPREAGAEVAKGVQQGIANSDLQGAYAGVPGAGGS